jgi:inner membrane protein
MDTLTHALSGALLARATASRKLRADTLPLGRRTFVGALAAAFPDSDVVSSYLSPLGYLYNHRGITHSLLLVPLWAILLSFILAAVWRAKSRLVTAPTPEPSWRAYAGVAALGVTAHILGDLITSFGTMVFAPLSDARYALSATFIIDLWFTGIIVIGLLASAIWRSSRVPAVAGLAVLCGYVAFQVVLQQRAIDFGEAYAKARGFGDVVVTAQPRPVSPFNWTVLVAEADRYHYAHVNLIRKSVPPEPDANTGFVKRLDAAYKPLADATWVHLDRYGAPAGDAAIAREVYSHPGFRFFRWFAAYPAVLRVDTSNPGRCVWFYDLRFATPGRSGTPFRYGMCRDAAGAWSPFQLVGDEKRPVY